MAGFSLQGGLEGNQSPVLMEVIIDASVQLTIGDSVMSSVAGHAALGTAGSRLTGIVMGFKDKYGLPVSPTSGSVNAATYTVESTNEGTEKVAAIVNINPLSIYSIESSATIGTTTTNSLTVHGVLADLTGTTGAQLLDETTTEGGGASGSGGQFRIFKVDPDNSSNFLVTIRESEFHA